MKSGFMRLHRRNLAVLIILLTAILLLFHATNPYAKHNREITRTLVKFYDAFKIKDYYSISETMTSGNPQGIINERDWYGDVNGYRLLLLFPTGKNQKKAYIRVSTFRADKEEFHYDTVYLEKNQEWTINNYRTTMKYSLP